jgi:ankyrin repeat protein
MATLSEATLKEIGLSPNQSEGLKDPIIDLSEALLHCAYYNVMEGARLIIAENVSVNFVDPATGMNALHIAVGRDHLDMARYLVEKGVAFVPDIQGRMPTTVAAECEVSNEMCDFIAEAEAKAEGV